MMTVVLQDSVHFEGVCLVHSHSQRAPVTSTSTIWLFPCGNTYQTETNISPFEIQLGKADGFLVVV